MKLAASTLGCPDWSLAEICANFRSFGYEGIELRGLGPDLDLTQSPAFATPGVATRSRRAIEDAGLTVCSVDCSASFADPACRVSSIGETQNAIQLAHLLDAPLVRVFGGSIPNGLSRSEALPAMADTLRRLGDYAQSHGDVTLILETHDSFSTGAEVAEVLAQVNHTRVAALWDLHHPYRHGEVPSQTYSALAPYLRHVHVKDSHPPNHYCLLTDGDVPVFEMLRLLQSGGYDGWLSLEWEKRWQPSLLEAPVVFPQYATKLRQYLAELTPES